MIKSEATWYTQSVWQRSLFCPGVPGLVSHTKGFHVAVLVKRAHSVSEQTLVPIQGLMVQAVLFPITKLYMITFPIRKHLCYDLKSGRGVTHSSFSVAHGIASLVTAKKNWRTFLNLLHIQGTFCKVDIHTGRYKIWILVIILVVFFNVLHMLTQDLVLTLGLRHLILLVDIRVLMKFLGASALPHI